jgi:hypothetical protein
MTGKNSPHHLVDVRGFIKGLLSMEHHQHRYSRCLAVIFSVGMCACIPVGEVLTGASGSDRLPAICEYIGHLDPLCDDALHIGPPEVPPELPPGTVLTQVSTASVALAQSSVSWIVPPSG